MSLLRLLSSLIFLVSLTLTVRGDDLKSSCEDTNNIHWHTPDRFTEARDAAGKQKRMMMIKGIAFGIDAVGAKCATKGCW